MNDELLSRAVRNNAQWCDLICSTHDIDTESLSDIWMTRSLVPQFYPNAITLTPTASGQEIAAIPLDHFSVKDSFACLNLENLGFSKLFDATWIGMEHKKSKAINVDLWKKLSLDEELIAWENAWGNTTDERIFLPGLLYESEVGIYAKKEGAGIAAGFVAFDSERVISVSNVFNNTLTNIWPEIVQLVTTNKPLVGYERDEELENAKRAGFDEIEHLTIWKK